MVFERTLIDLIKGIRSHANDEEAFIATCLLECRKEATSQDADLKSEAILKLAYVRSTLFIKLLTKVAGNVRGGY